MHYTAAHYYDPNRAVFQDFEPFWEFVSGPLHAGTWAPGELDNTFGPAVMYQKGCSAEQGENLAPCFGLQFFGHVAIDGETEVMTVTLKDVERPRSVVDPDRAEASALDERAGGAAHLHRRLRPQYDCHVGRVGLNRAAHQGQNHAPAIGQCLRPLAATAAHAQTVYPIDRADILAGARFDFKVEFAGRLAPDQIKVTVNGADLRRCSARRRASSSARTARTNRRSSCATSRCRSPASIACAPATAANTREVIWNVYEHRAAAGQERDPVHRRRHVAGAPHRRAAVCPRALPRARRSASSRSTTCRTRRWSRPPAAIPSSPTRPTR